MTKYLNEYKPCTCFMVLIVHRRLFRPSHLSNNDSHSAARFSEQHGIVLSCPCLSRSSAGLLHCSKAAHHTITTHRMHAAIICRAVTGGKPITQFLGMTLQQSVHEPAGGLYLRKLDSEDLAERRLLRDDMPAAGSASVVTHTSWRAGYLALGRAFAAMLARGSPSGCQGRTVITRVADGTTRGGSSDNRQFSLLCEYYVAAIVRLHERVLNVVHAVPVELAAAAQLGLRVGDAVAALRQLVEEIPADSSSSR